MEDEAKAEVLRAFKAGSPHETINAVALVSIALSQKRQADALEGILDFLTNANPHTDGGRVNLVEGLKAVKWA